MPKAALRLYLEQRRANLKFFFFNFIRKRKRLLHDSAGRARALGTTAATRRRLNIDGRDCCASATGTAV